MWTALEAVCLNDVVRGEKVGSVHNRRPETSLPCGSMGTTSSKEIGSGPALIYGCPQSTGPTTDPAKITYIEEQKQGRRAR